MVDVNNADIIKAYADVPQQLIEDFGDEGDLTRQYLLNLALFSLLGGGARYDVARVTAAEETSP